MPKVPRFDMGGIGLQPITDDWGFSRGHPVDRHYIESFLMRHAGDIRGAVLEVGDRGYTQRFGEGRVTTSDVLDVQADNAAATYVADLRDATSVPSDTFDCFILTQVLVLIRETPRSVARDFPDLETRRRCTNYGPGDLPDQFRPAEADGWSWSSYPATLRWLLSKANFERDTLTVEAFGNLRTTVAFLAGLAQTDLDPGDFESTIAAIH